MYKKLMMFLGIGILFIAGCGSSEKPVEKTQVAKPPLSKAEQLKEQAKVAEAASLVGYDGKAIRKDLEKIIDQSEAENKRLKEIDDLR